MADQSNNVINNYKGVMLCSRPNEKKAIDYERPFCGRVVPGELLGINPVKHESNEDERPKHKRLAALEKHKQWLSSFKEGIQKTKGEVEENAKREQERFKKIREQAEADRERARKMKEQYNQAATQTNSGANAELNTENLRRLDAQNQKKKADFKKKPEKPVWAMTKEQLQENEDQQVDELIDFFETNHVKDFSEDIQVKQLLIHLKQKIEKMRQSQNWKEKQADRMKKVRQERKDEGEDDKYSQFSVGNSQGKSVASQKTQKKIEELRNKKNQQEWDKHTATQKSSIANIDERIAKNLADEVLRNYPNMKGVHSNVSIRKLLEAQAAKVMSQPIMRPVITTIVKQKQQINANTLPYLHRNPAI